MPCLIWFKILGLPVLALHVQHTTPVADQKKKKRKEKETYNYGWFSFFLNLSPLAFADFKHALVLEPQNKVANLAEKRLRELMS